MRATLTTITNTTQQILTELNIMFTKFDKEKAFSKSLQYLESEKNAQYRL